MAAAAIFLDYSAFAGPVVQTNTGYNWRLFAVVREPTTNAKITLQSYSADTLDADTPLQIRDKIIAATKSHASKFGFDVTAVLIHPMNVVAPV